MRAVWETQYIQTKISVVETPVHPWFGIRIIEIFQEFGVNSGLPIPALAGQKPVPIHILNASL